MRYSTSDQSHYTFQVYVQDPSSGKIYDFSKAVETATWQTYRLSSQPGTLELVLDGNVVRDRNIELPPGCRIRFGVNGEDFFYGLTEEVELMKSTEKRYRLPAVDHLRFLQSVESAYRAVGSTASGFFEQLMTEHNARIRSVGSEGFNFAVREASTAPLDDYYFSGVTLYSMLKSTLALAHIAEPRQYMLRDNMGTIEFRELKALRRPLIIGDESFGESYTYGVMINNQTYNIIRVVRDNEEIGKREVWQRYHSINVRNWGPRQLTIEADDHLTDAEISAKIDLHLAAFNRVRRKLKLTCVGINGLQAGDGVQIRLDDARIDAAHWIENCTHVYSENSHMMDLELYLV